MTSLWHAFLAEHSIDEPGRGGPPWVMAHRGYSGVAPENTLPAIEAARLIGCDYIEIDLANTSDGVPVIIHDDDVDRTTDGKGDVDKKTFAQLADVDAGSWRGPGYTGVTVPRLDEVLAGFQSHGGRLLLEFKDYWDPVSVGTVGEMIREAELSENVIIQSFNVDTVRSMRDIVPDLPRGLLRFVPRLEDLELIEELGAICYNPGLRGFMLRQKTAAEILAHDIGMFVWTADKPEDWDRLMEIGVNGIISNQPGRLQGYIAAKFGKGEE
ncbi:glycerophosphodiester phosphodiesterase family protein [Saxibacter everestensis]|uniref:Glycerophosphodiester phosphodiesterase family protein n=1 Tax=Saxibacter everestensis TaxID=2909229 RepID=A0ABY8QRH8_9MICO|nr:glycerophosphodiester phosphodiesterase family protein [Brevibacteriaceae bacterium ZFBP1038]